MQKSISIFRAGQGFVYEADQSAITTAKENVASAKYDIEVDYNHMINEKLYSAFLTEH